MTIIIIIIIIILIPIYYYFLLLSSTFKFLFPAVPVSFDSAKVIITHRRNQLAYGDISHYITNT